MREQHGFSFTGQGQHVQHLTTRDYYHQYEAQRQRQAEVEAQARQRNFRGNSVTPEALPKVRSRPDADEDLCTRPPRSAVKYQPEIYRQGSTQVNKYTSPPPPNHKHAIPPRRSAQYQQPPEEPDAEEIDEQVVKQRGYRRPIRPNFLVFLGIALLLMIAGGMALNDLGTWWQNHQDDVTYGMPRTYQTDAVVGHNDSNSNPSHFIAINLRGSIYVIEAPGGNISHAREYFITTEVGGNPNPPVTIKFEDLTHSGRLDMVVSIGDPPTPLIVFLFNNGSQFIAKSQ